MAGGAVQPWPVRAMRTRKDRPWTEEQARQDLLWWAGQGGRPGLRVLAQRWHWTGRSRGCERVAAFLRAEEAGTPRGTPTDAKGGPLPGRTENAGDTSGDTSGDTQRRPARRQDVRQSEAPGSAATTDEPPGRAQDRWARQHEPRDGDPVELARAAYWAMVDEPGRDRSRFTEATYRTYAAFAATARVLFNGGHGSLIFKLRDAREIGPCASKAQAVERAILLMTAELRPAPPRVRSGP